jgi:hypothetical protein
MGWERERERAKGGVANKKKKERKKEQTNKVKG